jgi:hypothetical protein
VETLFRKEEPMTNVERLQELLDAKDEELEKLRRELENAKALLNHRGHVWRALQILSKEQTLPVPRLEIVVVSEEDRLIWEYHLVYRSLSQIVALPMERTIMMGPTAPAVSIEGRLHLPSYMGAFIYEDMVQLRLPGFAVFGEHVDDLVPRVRT